MKNYFLVFILSIFIVRSYSQQKPPMIDINEDISLSGLADSIRSNYGDQKSTRLLKNLNAKIKDYLIINHDGDTIIVDTSLTINKFHKINFDYLLIYSYLQLIHQIYLWRYLQIF